MRFHRIPFLTVLALTLCLPACAPKKEDAISKFMEALLDKDAPTLVPPSNEV